LLTSKQAKSTSSSKTENQNGAVLSSSSFFTKILSCFAFVPTQSHPPNILSIPFPFPHQQNHHFSINKRCRFHFSNKFQSISTTLSFFRFFSFLFPVRFFSDGSGCYDCWTGYGYADHARQ
jgi:hypothetical protein